jgi:exonuclease III
LGECWLEILEALESYKGERICLMGDFNAIRSDDERKGAEGYSRRTDIQAFNNFIQKGEFVVDLPMAGKKFTWWRSNGPSMSSFLSTKLVNS